METFVFDCPSCAAKNSTFDVNGLELRPNQIFFIYWVLFSTCRACKNSICINAELNLNGQQNLKRKQRYLQ